MALFLYRIEPSRAGMPEAPTPTERSNIDAHFAYLKAAYEAGVVKYVGRTQSAPHLGIAVFEAADQDAATRFLAEDPAVKAGVFRGLSQPFAEVFPMRGA
jgi:uncharacterized protein YciI